MGAPAICGAPGGNMILQYLDSILGNVPQYSNIQSYEIVRYVLGGILLIFMVSLVYRMILTLFGGWSR